MTEKAKDIPVAETAHPGVLKHFAKTWKSLTGKVEFSGPVSQIDLTPEDIVAVKTVINDWHDLKHGEFKVKYKDLYAKDSYWPWDEWIPVGKSLTDPKEYNIQAHVAEGNHNDRDPGWPWNIPFNESDWQ